MTILSYVLQGLLIFMFLFAGMSKIVGSAMQVQAFKQLRLPQWFRVVTGLTTMVGVIGLIIGFWNKELIALAALWIACIMVGAVISHIRVKHPFKQMVAAIVLLVLALILAFIQ
ncbi:DoxX family protein [Paenibacillus agilis]|uniref:DoxX family protein n=1 Tax=Paenibacillus agilis TaxID=3020863 RepID=A0A559IVQ2_9BACL|nr:DoxX family protein [Paenibacillus agilis]TVX91722.1 DoxX family protein [Paenibacillus agilis]